MKKLLILVLMMTMVGMLSACSFNPKGNDLEVKNWSLITSSAQESTITVAIDHSNLLVATWFKETFAEHLKATYDMTVKVIEQPLTKTLATLEEEKTNGIEFGKIDIVIFEKEGFKEAKTKGLLYGPFADKLQNTKANMDTTALSFLTREGILTDYYAVPYGQNQLSYIYNQDVFYETPEDYDGFLALLEEFKGQFTYPDPRTSKEGEAFVLSIIGQDLDFEPFLTGDFDRKAFILAIQPGLDRLIQMKPLMKDQGTVYPETTKALDDLFINGAVMMSLSMDYNYATAKLKEYEYPEGASTFVVPTGVATYLEVASIAYNSPNKSGAIVAINELLSPEMQVSKYDPKEWGSLPVFSDAVAEKTTLDQFKTVKLKSTTVKYNEFIPATMPEFTKEMIQVVLEQWETQVLKGE